MGGLGDLAHITALILALAAISPACGEEGPLTSTACDEPCYHGPPLTLGVGECRAGRPICDDGNYLGCEDSVTPDLDVCDGLDNDCDGATDEDCKAQELACLFPGPEVCNGVDDDCDGLTDDLPVGPLCYGGDPATLAHGRCRAGVVACVGGRWACAYQVLPVAEVCNGVDDDCNGAVDDLDEAVDVAFVVDASGSMYLEEIAWVRSILARVAELLEEDRFRLAVVLSPLFGPRPPTSTVARDFLDPEAFLSEEVAEAVKGHNGGDEPLYDVMHDLAKGELLLSWRECATRWQVLFTDVHLYEELSFRDPPLEEGDVAAAIEEAGRRVLVVHKETASSHLLPFDEIVLAGGGRFLHLSRDVEGVARAIVQEVSQCAP